MLRAGAPDEEKFEALEQLCQAYWAPLYAFVRREGPAPHEAEDIVQGFFQRLLAQDSLRTSPSGEGALPFLLARLLAELHGQSSSRQSNGTARRQDPPPGYPRPGRVGALRGSFAERTTARAGFRSCLGRDRDAQRGTAAPKGVRRQRQRRTVRDHPRLAGERSSARKIRCCWSSAGSQRRRRGRRGAPIAPAVTANWFAPRSRTPCNHRPNSPTKCGICSKC